MSVSLGLTQNIPLDIKIGKFQVLAVKNVNRKNIYATKVKVSRSFSRFFGGL